MNDKYEVMRTGSDGYGHDHFMPILKYDSLTDAVREMKKQASIWSSEGYHQNSARIFTHGRAWRRVVVHYWDSELGRMTIYP